jgi:hypothetical protein
LQQAAGNVRCGNCSHAFNALHYLTEEMPEQAEPADYGQDDEERDELAETSRHLLETLDKLAGPEDVRIEDTGVEWRVLDEAAASDVSLSPEDSEVLRFDDNTPLPDNFDDEDSEVAPSAPQRRETDIEKPAEEFDERQSDLALSDPEDWTDILEEVRDPAESLEVEEELAAIHTELSAIDEALTDEVPQLDEDEFDAEEPDAEAFDDSEYDLEPVEDELTDEDDTGVFEVDGEQAAPEDEEPEKFEEPEEADDVEESEDEDTEVENLDDHLTFDTDEEEDEVSIPDQTEEEMTVNTEIDEELMAAADSDKDFTATLIGMENPEDLFDENSGEVETIIMEGESIRSEIEKERLAAENAARSQLDDPARLADTYALSREKLRGGRRRYDPPSPGMLAAIAALALLLVVQLVHNSRESLATNGFFNQTVAPVYRMLGSPVTPEWNIKGWQFEATNGSVDADETTLTIISRIVNRSGEDLPYPLVHLSLTNRYEDIMGSRILEPGEYLASDLDPSKPVRPGDNFTAVLKVEEPSPEATGFKLNVCYRAQPGTVRCAIEDFKN